MAGPPPRRPRRLDLGAGRDRRPGYLAADRVLLPGLDLVLDLEHGLPFADGAFDEILCSHVLEHVERFVPLVEELRRVSAPGARLEVLVPYLSYYGSFTDPTHRRFFGYRSFDYFSPDGPFNFYSRARFHVRRREIRFFWRYDQERRGTSRLVSGLINRFPKLYERFFCWILPANEILFVLEPAPYPEGHRP